jgi:hypothetical protein
MTTLRAVQRLVNCADAGPVSADVRSRRCHQPEEARDMYVVVLHQFQDPPTAFRRGERLVMNEGAPAGVRGLEFYPAVDGSAATCLWESDSVEAVQDYVDSTLGDASVNTCWEVDAEKAFAEQPLGLRTPAAIRG